MHIRQVLEWGLVLLVALACYALHFYHYFPTFGSEIFYFNDADDAQVYLWNTWHFAHQWHLGNNPFYTDYICTETGTGLWMHAYTIWFGIINSVVHQEALAINLGMAIQLVVAFIGFYFFAKRYVNRPILAFLVAYLAVYNGYILAKVGVHYNLVLIGIVPLLLLQVVRTFAIEEDVLVIHPKKIWTLVLGLVIAFFMDYYMVFYTLAFLVIYLLWYGVLRQWFASWTWKKGVVLAAVLGVGHIILRLLRISGFDEKGAIWVAADIRLFFMPGLNSQFLNGSLAAEMAHTLNDNKVFVGIRVLVFLLAAVFFFVRDYKQDGISRFWLFASVLFFFVTFPVIRIGDVDLLYNFTSIVHYIPFVNNVRAPDRFIFLFFVSIGIFMGRIIYLLSHDYTSKRIIYQVAIGMGILFYVSYKQQIMRAVYPAPEATELANTHDQQVVIIPFGLRDGYQQFGDFDEEQLLLQVRYGFKMPSGYLSRLSTETWAYYQDQPLYQNLVHLQHDSAVVDYAWAEALAADGIEKLYVSKEYVQHHSAVSAMLAQLPLEHSSDEYGTLYVIQNENPSR